MQLPESFWGKFSCRIITLNLWKVNYSQIWKKNNEHTTSWMVTFVILLGGRFGGGFGKVSSLNFHQEDMEIHLRSTAFS